jgi:Tol biopolymer transport system component
VDVEGTVSPDGRFLSYVDWETGDLALHDFATGGDRRLTNKGTWAQSDEFAEESTISRDGKQVAYSWFNGKDRYELRTASLPASGLVQPRRIFDSEDVLWIGPYDWSPDGKWIAVCLTRMDPRVHGLVSAQVARCVCSVNVDSGGRMSFSGRRSSGSTTGCGRPCPS